MTTFVATVKPGSHTSEKVRTMVSLGITAFRINFARSQDSNNFDLLRYCRTYSAQQGKECTLFVDLPGPKLRLGSFLNGSEQLVNGQEYCLDLRTNLLGDHRRAYVVDSTLHRHASAGNKLILCDGRVVLEVIDKLGDQLRCQVLQGGKIYTNCGVAIEGLYLENQELSQRDQEILGCLDSIVDFICPSFVDSPLLVSQVHEHTGTAPRQGVIAKIESPLGVATLAEIASQCEGIMLCRGDLKTFYNSEEIESLGLRMKELTHDRGKRLVFATDYFRSMVDGGTLSETDYLSLKRALELRPDYLIINETSYSQAWLEIAATSVALQGELDKA